MAQFRGKPHHHHHHHHHHHPRHDRPGAPEGETITDPGVAGPPCNRTLSTSSRP